MLDPQRTLANLVLDHPETAQVLQRHRLDFCCKGHVALGEALAAREEAADIVAEIEQAIAQRRGGSGIDARIVGTDVLVRHITERHHAYLRQVLPFLAPLAEKVARVHGAGEPRLVELRELVLELKAALEPHLRTEEEELFPALLSGSAPDVVARELAAMRAEHEAVGALLHRIRAVTADYAPARTACNSYRTLFSELEALEGDILTHVHLENHVLAPRFAPAGSA